MTTRFSICWLLLVLSLVAMIFLSLPPTPLWAEESTTIIGRLVNGTQGATLPSDLTITVRAFRGNQEVGQWVTIAQEGAVFQFDHLPTGPDFLYLLSAEYQRVLYTLRFERGSLPVSVVDLVVYETTPLEKAVFTLDAALVVSHPRDKSRRLKVTEIYRSENSSDRTIVPSEGQANPLFRFPMLRSAEDLNVETNLPGLTRVSPIENLSLSSATSDQDDSTALSKDTLALLDKGFVVTRPIPPGRYDLIVSYTIPYEGEDLSIVYSAPFGVRTFNVLLAEDLGTVKGPNLEARPSTNFEGTSYQVWEARDIPSGSSLALTLLRSSSSDSWQGMLVLVVLLAIGLILIGGAVYFIISRRRHTYTNV